MKEVPDDTPRDSRAPKTSGWVGSRRTWTHGLTSYPTTSSVSRTGGTLRQVESPERTQGNSGPQNGYSTKGGSLKVRGVSFFFLGFAVGKTEYFTRKRPRNPPY